MPNERELTLSANGILRITMDRLAINDVDGAITVQS